MTTETINQCPWSNFEKGSFPLCENRLLCEWISQPSNTFSNLAFFICSFLLIYLFFKKRSHHGLVFGLSTFYIGCASFIAHASGAKLFSFFDFSAIFAVFTLCLVLNAAYSGKIQPKKQLPYFVIGYIGVSSLIYIMPFLREIVFAGFVISLIIWEFKLSKKQGASGLHSSFKKALMIFGLGAVALLLDATKLVCDPDNHIIQLHAVWHICNAFALYFVALNYDNHRKPLEISSIRSLS